MFDHTVKAFNFSERFRIPVIILSDEVVGHIREKVFIPDADELEFVQRKTPTVPMALSFAPAVNGVLSASMHKAARSAAQTAVGMLAVHAQGQARKNASA